MSKNDKSKSPFDWIILAGLILLGVVSAASVLTSNNFFLN